MNRNNYL